MNLSIEKLGPCRIPSPISLSKVKGDYVTNYVEDDAHIVFDPTLKSICRYKNKMTIPAFEIAGPRDQIYFDPSKVHAAIVTCGGLCPGLNNVIQSIVLELWYLYGVRNIIGIRYGYSGFLPEYGYETMDLDPKTVEGIHAQGGTILGSSRGGADTGAVVDALEKLNISMLFTIGGDGTLKGALDIHNEVKKRKLKISVIGIPKTIDNDVSYVSRTFGFETAFSLATNAIQSAHIEAKGAYNGIGLVKLMGRDSGYIAANATLANHDVNFVLVPEVPFDMDGENGFLIHLKKRLEARQHALICVAEGAAQDQLVKDKAAQKKDASGNVVYADVGLYLKEKISEYLKKEQVRFTLKYIDPSYMIRSSAAIPTDAVYCGILGQNAVHAAMTGRTGMIVGNWNGMMTHVPISAVIQKRKKIDPDGSLWLHVVEATGQPMSMLNSL